MIRARCRTHSPLMLLRPAPNGARFLTVYADVRVLSNDAVGFTATACERVADNAEGLLVVPPPAPPAPPPSKDSLRIAACQQMLPSVPLAQRRSWSAWPAAPHGDPEVVVHEDLRALLVGGRSAVVRVEKVLVDDFQSGDLVYCCVTASSVRYSGCAESSSVVGSLTICHNNAHHEQGGGRGMAKWMGCVSRASACERVRCVRARAAWRGFISNLR
jgi:hypothetical protein